jgi:hypothetical protein
MRWLQRFDKMHQEFPNRPQVGDEADQPDIATTVGTRQRKRLTHPCQQLRPDDSRRIVMPRTAGRIPPSGGDARGTLVWAGGLLEDQHVQSPVGHQLLQPRVLLLNLLKLLRHLRIHPTATNASRRCPVHQR